MKRLVVSSVAALVLLVAAAILLYQPVEPPSPVPLRGSLELLPASFVGWAAAALPSADALPHDASAPHHLLRSYANGVLPIWVSVAYYGAQRAGSRPPARDLLFPRQGWTELSEREVTLPVDAGDHQRIPANLVLMTTARQRLAILYWYQVGQRAVASDHWYRALVVYNRLVHGRTDGALVRLVSPIPEGISTEAVVDKQALFLRAFYPELLQRLPR